MVLILVLQRWLPNVPAVLIMVVLAIASTTVFHLATHGVSLVGELPKGFPPLTIPHVALADLGPLFASVGSRPLTSGGSRAAGTKVRGQAEPPCPRLRSSQNRPGRPGGASPAAG
jgi:Sulfate permease family